MTKLLLNPEYDNVRASVVYRQIENDGRANQIGGFTTEHDKFLLIFYIAVSYKIV